MTVVMIALAYESCSDLDLKTFWGAGDEIAFNELYARHWPNVERSALRFKTFLIDPEERVSIANFVFGIKSSLYDGRAKFSTFMYRCVHSQLIDEVRARRSRPAMFFRDLFRDTGISPEENSKSGAYHPIDP